MDTLIESQEGALLARCRSREMTLLKSTMALIVAFVTDGDTEEEAKNKVKDLSNEITSNAPGAKYDFVLGNTQPLLDAVNASVLGHMTAAKKQIVTDILNQAV